MGFGGADDGIAEDEAAYLAPVPIARQAQLDSIHLSMNEAAEKEQKLLRRRCAANRFHDYLTKGSPKQSPVERHPFKKKIPNTYYVCRLAID